MAFQRRKVFTMSQTHELTLAAEMLRASRRIVVFTGAGISAESGIPTFRDDGGFWERFPIADFASWRGVIRAGWKNPRKLAEFVYEVIQPIADAEPNAAHRAIATLEAHVPTTVVTQNIDGLHQEADNSKVLEIHGSIFGLVSLQGTDCGVVTKPQLRRMATRLERIRHGWLALPRMLWAIRRWIGLGLRGIHRPKLVLFGDGMAQPDWEQAVQAARDCDCFIQIGCSGAVYPAALLPEEAAAHGATTIAIDPQPTQADVWLSGTATEIVPQLIELVSTT